MARPDLPTDYDPKKAGARTAPVRTIIREGRERTGLSQEQLAEKLNMDPRTLRRYESGEFEVPNDTMQKVADLAGDSLLMYRHLKDKYHIRDDIMPPVRPVPLAVAVLHLLAELRKLEKTQTATRLLELADDGVIDPGEKADFSMIMEKLDGVKQAVEMLRYSEKG